MAKPLIILFTLGVMIITLGATCSQSADPWAQSANAQATKVMADTYKVATQQAGDREVARLQSTQQAKAIEQQATQQAATAQAQALQATATAGPQQTSQALVVQATTQALQATTTANQLAAQATAAAYDYEQAERALALERAALTNQVRAAWGYFLGIILVVLALVMALVILRRLTRVQYIQPDPQGRLGVLVVNGNQVIDPGLMLGPVVDNQQAYPAQVPLDSLLAVKTNQQKLHAVQALAAGGSEGRGLASGVTPSLPMAVQVIEPGQIDPAIVDEVETKLLEAS